MITPILIYFLKVNLALAFLYICYRLLFRDDTFFRLRRGVLLSIYLIAFLYPLPDLSGWLSTQTSVAGIVGYYSGLLPKETVLTERNEIAASDWKEAGLKVMQVIWKEIGINHEFIADEQVMLAGFDKKEYQYHLIGVKHPNTAIANLYNNFSVLPLKKRITMLNKKRTNNARKMKYLALVPMAAGLLLLNNIDAMARVLNEKVAEVIQQPTALATTTVSKMEAANPLPPEKDKIYDTCDIMPEFPGGQNALLQFLAKNIKYPTEAQQQGKQGKVVVTFVIEKDGSITNAKVTQALYP